MHNFYGDENFTVKIQWINEVPTIHVQVDNWSLSVYKKMWVVWEELQEYLRKQGHTFVGSIIPVDPKTTKFNEIFGMKCIFNDGKYKAMVKDL